MICARRTRGADHAATILVSRLILSCGCSWTATSNTPWIVVNAPGSGDWQTPMVSYSVIANSTAGSRSGTLTINSQTFIVFQAGTASPTLTGSLAHLAVGGGFDSSIQLVNTGNSLAQASLSFLGDDGSPLAIPLSVVEDQSNVLDSGLKRSLWFPQTPTILIDWESSLIIRLPFGHLFTALIASLSASFRSRAPLSWRFSGCATNSESFNAP